MKNSLALSKMNYMESPHHDPAGAVLPDHPVLQERIFQNFSKTWALWKCT
jgi:hypothetical protein